MQYPTDSDRTFGVHDMAKKKAGLDREESEVATSPHPEQRSPGPYGLRRGLTKFEPAGFPITIFSQICGPPPPLVGRRAHAEPLKTHTSARIVLPVPANLWVHQMQHRNSC